MRKIINRKNSGWRGVFSILLISLLLLSYTSCSEDDSAADEYANWQERNETAINQYAADNSYRKIRTYTQDDTTAGKNSDYIYVKVLETGTGTESPLFTDTVRVAYRGRIIPTTSYPDGLVFDETYLNDFSWQTANMSDFVTGEMVNGFATALMNMHKGDRWQVMIPYQLGYGTSSTNSIRGYSNLIFEIALLDFWHIGDSRPAFRARKK